MNKYLELSDIASSSEGKIKIMDVTCFEYIIFAFKHLIDWTETGRKDKIAIRENILAAFEALRDFEGNPVPNGKGGFFDHLGEMKDSYTALNKVKKGLEGSLQNPNLSNIDKQILQDGLNQANSYLTRIEKLFKSHGGIK